MIPEDIMNSYMHLVTLLCRATNFIPKIKKDDVSIPTLISRLQVPQSTFLSRKHAANYSTMKLQN